MMRRIFTLFIYMAFATVAYSQVPIGKEYLFVYNLRTQYRRLKVHFSEQNDSLTLHWSFTNDEGTRQGTFVMSPDSRQHATRVCYVKPIANQSITTQDEELFALLSKDALQQLTATGKCRYNNTTLTLISTDANLYHVKDFDEGYEMWIENNPAFPLIHRMINNPVEIDWEVKTIEK